MFRAEGRRQPSKPEPDPLERGRFGDGSRAFTVCASSLSAPDSFQVYASENRADLVLIVSGLSTGDLHSTWGDEWRTRSAQWRSWARDCAFHVFHNGSLLVEPGANARRRGDRPGPGTIRHCDG